MTTKVEDAERVTDEQTGKVFDMVPERWTDVVAASVSILYSLGVMIGIGWLLLDALTGAYSLAFLRWYASAFQQNRSAAVELALFAALGGGLGATISNFRSFVQWHCERRAFGWRFVWKYLSMPPLGATLALMAYAMLQGGLAALGGATSRDPSPNATLSALAAGALAGYGSRQVFVWLDSKVNTWFGVDGRRDAAPDTPTTLPTRERPAEVTDITANARMAAQSSAMDSTPPAMQPGIAVEKRPAA